MGPGKVSHGVSAQGEQRAARLIVEDVMKQVKKQRVAMSAALALACLTWAAPGMADRLAFEGRVMAPSCPAASAGSGGYQYCQSSGGSGLARPTSAFTQQASALPSHSDIAMLDYFAQRPDGGTKVLVTRDYE
jgi:hypothetical protein